MSLEITRRLLKLMSKKGNSMDHIDTKYSIGIGANVNLFFNWVFLVGLAVFILLGGCVKIPSDLKMNFSDFHPKSFEDFPQQLGMEWWYQGKILENDFESSYVNRSRVEGKKNLQGVSLIVVSDTNPQDRGPVESYHRMDEIGVVYYGSMPADTLDEQLVPYRVLQFPIRVGSSFQQIDKKNLNLGEDLDGDWQDETVDIEAEVTVVRTESVTVPAGTYSDAILIKSQADMTIHLSSNRTTAPAEFTLMEWYVKGIGGVKRQFSMRAFVPFFGITKKIVFEAHEELLGVRTQKDEK